MNLQLDAMSVAMPHVVGHPNRLPFRGVLTLVGTASQRSPSGARGHRVLLTRAAADAALPSLLGMALDYAPSLDGHDARRKIGIITAADIIPIPHSKTSRVAGTPPSSPGASPSSLCSDGRGLSRIGHIAGAPPLPLSFGDRVASQSPTGQIAISGYLFAHDFPDAVEEIRAPGDSALGMSYEIANATVPNQEAAIWAVTDFTFTGAAVLRRDKAAYPQTWIALAADNATSSPKGGTKLAQRASVG